MKSEAECIEMATQNCRDCEGAFCSNCFVATATDALRRRMPRKPLEKRNTNGTMLYRCPTCKEPLRTRTQKGTKLVKKGAYCDACGQAIDLKGEDRWS